MPPIKKPESVPSDRIRSVVLGEGGRRQELSKAFLILKYTYDSAHALLEALRVMRSQRPATRGSLTDEEQDLLRAMLVMAASGLDSMTKQVIRDVLPTFCKEDPDVLDKFRDFVSRQLRGVAESQVAGDVPKLMAKWLTSESIHDALTEDYVGKLTGGSLQSVDQLFTVTNALGLPESLVGKTTLQPIFKDRNRIVHELDIDFNAPRRNRRNRKKGYMIQATNRLLLLAERLYIACESKLDQIRSSG